MNEEKKMIEMVPIQQPPLLDGFMKTVYDLGVPLPNLCQLDTETPSVGTPVGLAFLQEGWHYGCQMFVEHSHNPDEELENMVAKMIDINCDDANGKNDFYLWGAWVDMKGYTTGNSTSEGRDAFLRQLSRTMVLEGYKAFEVDAEGGC